MNEEGTIGAKLLEAAWKGRGDEALLILKAHPSLIHVRDPAQNTVLHCAAAEGHVDTIQQLVKFIRNQRLHDATTATNKNGDTPLNLALKNCHYQASLCLIQEINYFLQLHNKNKDGVSTLDLIQETGSVELLKAASDLGRPKPVPCRPAPKPADVEITIVNRELNNVDRRNNGRSLHMAIGMGKWNKVGQILTADRTLLQFQNTQNGYTVLHAAVEKGELRQLNQLRLTEAEIRSLALIKDVKGETALHKALRISKPDAHYLIKVAPEAAYQVNHHGLSPLYEAVQSRQDDLVTRLFEVMPGTSVTPSVKDSLLTSGKTSMPLVHAAIKARNMATLKVVMENLPFLINSKDKKGRKPISYAYHVSNVDAAHYLVAEFPECLSN